MSHPVAGWLDQPAAPPTREYLPTTQREGGMVHQLPPPCLKQGGGQIITIPNLCLSAGGRGGVAVGEASSVSQSVSH